MSKSKPRVLFIATLPPPNHGAAIVSQQIKDSNLINDEFQCDWINLSTSRYLNEIGKTNVKKILRITSSFLRTFWLLLTHKYDLCYLTITCHGVGFLKDSPFVLLCKLFNRRILIHHHNKGMSSDVDRFPYRWLLPLVYNKVKVILLSWNLYSDIEKVVNKEDVFICPNGIKINDNFFNNQNVNNVNQNEVKKLPRILFLSNLIESKGVFILLDALKILKEKGFRFICDFVGNESREIYRERFIEEVCNRGLKDMTIYHGPKYGKEKEQYYEQSDVFVFPSYYETFGLVILEAMAHKKPIVATNEGGIPDIVKDGENGLIAERMNSQSLADCIGKLLKDKELRTRMGIDGFNKLKEFFTTEVFENNMLRIIRECCSVES